MLHGLESVTAPARRAGWFEDEPVFTAGNEGGALLDIRFEHSEQLWPWSGFLALYVRVRDAGVTFSGQARPLSHPRIVWLWVGLSGLEVRRGPPPHCQLFAAT